ncbi:MAG: flagellar protein FlaG [Desulfamplus sp.]|nr:flagellar protein FlaG [Desulfamplus sp.]
MNINSIKTGDPMDMLSPLRSVKQTQEKAETVKTTKIDNQPAGADTETQLKTEQGKQLKNDTKLQGKEKEEDKKQTTMKEKDAQKMVDELNDYMDELQTSLGFSVTKDPENQIIFQIKDRTTNEVIRQIPTEEIQKIKEKMNELTGLLLDQHV